MEIRERILTGPEIEASFDALAAFRLEIFREYPYLYEGEREDELRYLRMYAEKPGAVVILAQESGKVAGAVTGIPLEHEDQELLEAFDGTDYPLMKSSMLAKCSSSRPTGTAVWVWRSRTESRTSD